MELAQVLGAICACGVIYIIVFLPLGVVVGRALKNYRLKHYPAIDKDEDDE